MTTGSFTEVIAGRDFYVPDTARYPTPAPTDCPNGDPASQFLAVAASLTDSAHYDDPTGLLLPPWGTADWSLEMWALRPAGSYTSSHQQLVFRPNNLWNVVWNGSSVWEFALRNDSSSLIAACDLPAVGTDIWQHMVWTVNSSLGAGAVSGREIKSYHNGALYQTVSIPSSAFTQTAVSGSKLYFGFDTQQIITAKVAIYHRLLSETDAGAHYDLMTT